MLNNDMQINAYISEQTKIIAENIKKGNNSYDDFAFALKKVKYNHIDNEGNKITEYGYNYSAYLKILKKLNNQVNIRLKEIPKTDYSSVTRLQEVIDHFQEKHNNMLVQKNRIETKFNRYNKKK